MYATAFVVRCQVILDNPKHPHALDAAHIGRVLADSDLADNLVVLHEHILSGSENLALTLTDPDSLHRFHDEYPSNDNNECQAEIQKYQKLSNSRLEGMLKYLLSASVALAVSVPGPASAAPCSALIHIGDSTTVAMSRHLRSDYESQGFTNVVISAGNGRSVTHASKSDTMSGLEAVRHWKTRTPEGRCWVIALGTNDVISNNKEERIDRMIGALGDDRAMWVNVYVDSKSRPKYNGLNAFAWNRLLTQKGVNVFDWASVVRPEWLSRDGIHYTAEGSKQRAKLIARAASGQ